MNVRIVRTHAKSGMGLYRSGEIYPINQVEQATEKIKIGLIEILPDVKVEVIQNKEEKKTRKRRVVHS